METCHWTLTQCLVSFCTILSAKKCKTIFLQLDFFLLYFSALSNTHGLLTQDQARCVEMGNKEEHKGFGLHASMITSFMFANFTVTKHQICWCLPFVIATTSLARNTTNMADIFRIKLLYIQTLSIFSIIPAAGLPFNFRS